MAFNTWAAGGEGACLTAKKPFISLPFPLSPLPAWFLFFFKLQKSPSEKTRYDTSHGLLTKKFISATEPITWWVLDLNKAAEVLKVQREGFMTSPMSWKASTSLRKKSKNNVQWMWVWVTSTTPVCWLWAGLGVGFLANCEGFLQPQLSHSCPHFIPFFLLLSSLSSSSLSQKFKVSLQRDLLFRWYCR